jgi:hypothetical protein
MTRSGSVPRYLRLLADSTRNLLYREGIVPDMWKVAEGSCRLVSIYWLFVCVYGFQDELCCNELGIASRHLGRNESSVSHL